MKRILSLVLAGAMALSLAACGGGNSNGGNAASANADYGIQVAAAEAASEKTGGKLTITCTWDGTLGNDSELIENCRAGSIPMITLGSSPLLSYIPEIAVFDMPSVYSDAESAYEGIGQFEEAFGPIMEQAGFKLLGMGFSKFRGLSTNRNIQTPDDFKGMTIRIMENKYHTAFWTNLGASPMPLAFSELYLSLQQGLVEAQDNPLQTLYSNKFSEVQDYFMPITAFPFVNFRLMNLDQFNALPAEYQQVLIDFAHEDLYNEYLNVEKDDADTWAAVGDSVTKLEYTDEIFQAMQEAAKPVWDSISADIGSEMCDAYLAAAGITR